MDSDSTNSPRTLLATLATLATRATVATMATMATMACAIALAAPARAAAPGDDIDALTPEQQSVARQMIDFERDTEQYFWQQVERLNGRTEMESQVFEPEGDRAARYDVRVRRGKVIEKAGAMTAITRTEKPPFVAGGRFNRFFEVAVHPRTPRVGMLHATFVVQVSSSGTSTIAGTIDQMRAAQGPEDLRYLDDRITPIFQKYGYDRERFRVKGCGQPNEGGWKWHRPSTCTGASIFGTELQVDEKNYQFVSEVFRAGLEAYFDILNKNYRNRYGDEELRAQDFMRRRWLEDQLFWDFLSRNFVPYEAWSLVNAPPVVKY